MSWIVVETRMKNCSVNPLLIQFYMIPFSPYETPKILFFFFFVSVEASPAQHSNEYEQN